jgi:hypothetical protein
MAINKRNQKIRDREKSRYHKDPAYHRRKLAAARRYYAKKRAEIRKRAQSVHLKDPRKRMVYAAKMRAIRDGVPFDLVYTDFEIPAVCPITERPFVRGQGMPADDSPSLDRVIPERGYVRGNVAVLSHRANKIKNDATPELLRRAADWLVKATASCQAESGPEPPPG